MCASAAPGPTLLIDVDGTIVDSLPGIVESFAAGLRAVGRPLPDQAFLDTLPGPPMVDSLAQLGLSEQEVETAMAAYMESQHSGTWRRSQLFDGWPELLAQWRDQGITLATATSKGEYFARATLDALGVLPFFDFLGTASDDGSRRTKIEVLRYTLSHLHIPVAPEQRSAGSLVMIGDRTHDFTAAAELGIPTIAVTWGYGTAEEYRQATAVVDSPAGLKSTVAEMLYI